MRISEYLLLVRRHWKLLVVCVLATVGAAALVTAQMAPTYVSTARVFVSTTQKGGSQAYAGSLFSAQRVTSYARLVNVTTVTSNVIKKLHLPFSPAELATKVDAVVEPATVILDINVTDTDPHRAQRIAQAVAEQLDALVTTLETPSAQSGAPIKATIVDSASLPTRPTSPEPARNLGLGALLGLVLGVGAAVLRESVDSTVRRADDIAEVAGIPVMGNIRHERRIRAGRSGSPLDGRPFRAEAFRVLRTNMQFADVDGDRRVFTVASAVHGEGRTRTATNLAIVLAQGGTNVLLLEADLRKPRLARDLQLQGTVGLTDILTKRARLDRAVQKTSVPNLSVLTSGEPAPNPADLLQSSAMAQLLNQARKLFDVVVVDTPPLLAVTDAALVAAQSDGTVIVVRHGRTTREQLDAAMRRLAGVDARVLGAVLNRIPRRDVVGRHEATSSVLRTAGRPAPAPSTDAPTVERPGSQTSKKPVASSTGGQPAPRKLRR